MNIFLNAASFSVSFFGDGHVEIPLIHTYSTIHLHVQFLTSYHSALLFLAAGQKDYLLLELHAGVLQVSKIFP